MPHLKKTAIALLAIAVLTTSAGCAVAGAQAESREAVRSAEATAVPAPEVDDSAEADAAAPLSAAVQAQVDYVLTYWSDYNREEYGVVSGNDCVNFASQSLLARGWQQDDEWYHGADGVYGSSDSWISSTAMRDWLETRPDLATALDDSQRDQVRVGDIAQFDWDNSGDRDHTGIVTKVEHTASGTKVYFAGHTLDSDYRDVDTAITVDHPGASVYYWSIAG